MENRTQRIFTVAASGLLTNLSNSFRLKRAGLALAAACLLASPMLSIADESRSSTGFPTANQSTGLKGLGDALEPKVAVRTVKEPKIDDENFEVGVMAGLMSIEHFGTSSVTSLFLNYHATEDIFLQASVHQSEATRTSFEALTRVDLITDDERDLSNYTLSTGIKILPGESFFWSDYAFNSSIVAMVGIGSTEFAGDDHFTISLGAGYRLLINDTFAAHIEITDKLFDLDLFGDTVTTHNILMQLGVSLFF